ncbi:MAG TPA: hypothetical protein PK511_09755 [Chitinophagales bacterium]|nr:hypothetical protein [Chitinophagales bacterium]HMU69622.1 hypothetical protein [Chitinophagales bacterium]HMX05360.1 hypothetical protein [Chitinophagales bacterium]HNE45190.1 hypothetical protein [Chitinophagales bacterium]HNI54794.1 hypothetical protein [Chitinophagales bacterium]
MKKIVAYIGCITLMATLLINSNGFTLWLSAATYHAKQEVWNRIEAGEVNDIATTLTIPLDHVEHALNGFSWRDDKHEFTYEGFLYDIIQMDMASDGYHIIAVRDDKEKDLEEKIASQLQHQNNTDQKHQSLPKLQLDTQFDVVALTAYFVPDQTLIMQTNVSKFIESSGYLNSQINPPDELI